MIETTKNQPLFQQLQIHSHLYEMYPNLPKFANDPGEHQLIRTYDLILKRYQGLYGYQPKYFIRSPASATLMGVQKCSELNSSLSTSSCCLKKRQQSLINFQSDYISLCLEQNHIIAINSTSKSNGSIKINHYQSAVYGEKIFDVQTSQWKYDDKNDQYTSLIVISLKAIALLYNIDTMPSIDILIYADFVQDESLHWKQSLCLGIYAALHLIIRKDVPLKRDMCVNFLRKISFIKSDINATDIPLLNNYGSLYHHSDKIINFPQQLDIIVAHSMTPVPKMMIQGKRHNLRACEILLGIQIIKGQIGGSFASIKSLKQLQNYLDTPSLKLFREAIDQYLPKNTLTTDKIEQLTEKSLIDILKQVPFANNVIDENINFKPYQRIIFYIKELQLIDKLLTLDEKSQEYCQQFCQIIQQNYKNSLQHLQISSEQLNQMVSLTKDLSAGYKIVGNGWGGNLIIFSHKKNTRHIYDILINQFYMSEENRILLSDDVEQYIKIVGKPSSGLAILDPQSQIWF